MTKSYFLVGLALLGVITLIGVVYLFTRDSNDDQVNNNIRNATYIIEGQEVTLKDGISEVSITPDSATKVVTEYFGNEVMKDFNGDGKNDTAFIVTQTTGGSGTFYYVVVALNTDNGYVGSEGYLLGDRIAPQTTELGQGNIIIVNYADRNQGESFAVQPSVGKKVWLLLDPLTMQFGVVEQNFAGEADPERMSLNMKTWNWQSIENGDGEIVATKNPEKFALTFNDNRTFSAKTDCNGIGGRYSAEGKNLKFTEMVSTLMFCADSNEQVFSTALSEVESYYFTGKGQLIFILESDKGLLIFK